MKKQIPLAISNAHVETVSLAPSRQLQSDIERRDELARLLPVWPRDLDDLTLNGRKRIVKLIERALRAERQRGRAGHWAYDLARHAALHRNWKRECQSLRTLEIALAARGPITRKKI